MVSTVERCSWLRKIVPNLVPIFVHYYHHHHSCSAATIMLEMGTFSDSRIDGIFSRNWPEIWWISDEGDLLQVLVSGSFAQALLAEMMMIVERISLSLLASVPTRAGLFATMMMAFLSTRWWSPSSLYSRCRRETIFHIHLSHPWSSWLWSVVCIIFPSSGLLLALL